MHKVLVNRLVKLAQEKSVVRSTDLLDMTISVDWEIKPQTKQTLASPLHMHYVASELCVHCFIKLSF